MKWLSSNYQRPKVFRFVILSFLSFSLALGLTFLSGVHPAHSQFPNLPSNATNGSLDLPSNVKRYGEYEVANIYSPLDNKLLFEIASPTIFNRNDIPEGRLPVEIRAQEVNERLWRVFQRTVNANGTPDVSFKILNNRPVILISDDQTTRPIRLVTVTEPDADWNGKNLEELAEHWKTLLQDEVARFKELTQPKVIQQRIGQASQILLGLIVASIVIWLLYRLINRRQQTLKARYQKQLEAIAKTEKASKSETMVSSDPLEGEEAEAREIADLRSQLLEKVQHKFSTRRQLDVYKFLKWVLFWTFILMWYVGIYVIMSIIPILMRWSMYVLATPLALLVIWFGISLAIRVSKSLIDRFMHTWKASPILPFGEIQRIALRTATIAEALKGLVTFVLIIVGIIWTLSLFNIPTGSILAGSAVIGLAISFGSQSLVKDLVNGCLILLEDQYAVGDFIQVDDKDGLVENLNLRVTQLRNGEGQLITIPNSNISNVRNLTRLWSRVNFSIIVAYENDPRRVLEILQQVSTQLYSEPEWRDRLPEPPDVLGINDLSHTGMEMSVWIKTAPMEQWSVGREFRLRVREAFEANHIQIGRPEWIVYNPSSELNE